MNTVLTFALLGPLMVKTGSGKAPSQEAFLVLSLPVELQSLQALWSRVRCRKESAVEQVMKGARPIETDHSHTVRVLWGCRPVCFDSDC